MYSYNKSLYQEVHTMTFRKISVAKTCFHAEEKWNSEAEEEGDRVRREKADRLFR